MICCNSSAVKVRIGGDPKKISTLPLNRLRLLPVAELSGLLGRAPTCNIYETLKAKTVLRNVTC